MATVNDYFVYSQTITLTFHVARYYLMIFSHCFRSLLKPIAFSALCLSGTMCMAQNGNEVCDLLKRYEVSGKSGRVKIANRFFEILKAEDFIEKPIKFGVRDNKDSVNLAVWYWAGEYLYDVQRYEQALGFLLNALPLFRDAMQKADCQNTVSIAYFRMSDYARALEFAKKSLAYYRERKDDSRISTALNTIAGIYLASKHPDESRKYILEAIGYSKAAHDTARYAIQCGMASEIFHSLNDNAKALEYARKALETDRKLGNKAKIGIRLSQMATAQIALGKRSEAEKSLNQAIPLLKENGRHTSLGICYNQMGTMLCEDGKCGRAAMYFRDAARIFEEKKDLYNESKSRKGLYEATKESNPHEAMRHLLRYTQIKDTLYRKEMQQTLGQYDAKYRNEELKLANEREKLEKKIIVATGSAFIVMLIGALTVLTYYIAMRKKNSRLQKSLLETKERFFTNITHEFRTPLTVINSAAQDIMRQCGGNAEMESCASDILHHEQRLLNLVNQILDITKLQSNHSVNVEWTHDDIIGFAGMLCERLAVYARAKGVGLSFVPEEQSVEMDFIPDYMHKIIQNLVSNAVKYSSGGEILVSAKTTDGQFVMQVKDHGTGMTGEQLQNVFKPFYQVADNGKNAGTGIGLSLVKLTAEAMGGKVSAESTLHEGSVFTVSIPITNCRKKTETIYAGDGNPPLCDSSRQEMPADPNGEDDNAVCVLIAEDVPDVAKYTMRRLNPEYRFVFASDGKEALEKAAESVPDIVITDVMMPGMDGYELCRHIRESELLNHIPVIMVTAKITHRDRMQGLEAGADAYLEKPFHADELKTRVEKLLGQRRMLQQKFSQSHDGNTENAPAGISGKDNRFISKMDGLIAEMIKTGKLDYGSLAYEMCVSRAQLNRKIKAISGNTTTEYIARFKTALAKKLLSTTDLPIWEVAEQCGMQNAAYFGSVFKKATGQTPLQYRNGQKA